MPRIALAALLLFAWGAAPAAALEVQDRTIVPGERVGAIKRSTKPAELAKIFGARNVRYTKLVLEEGEEQDGAVIFPGGDQELRVGFLEDRIDFVRIRGKRWQTAEGLRIGATLAELERLNGGPFEFAGFGWDYGGQVYTEPPGQLQEGLDIFLTITREPSGNAWNEITGDRRISSRHPALADLGVEVMLLILRFRD
jgi:hypothetical protein